MVTTGAVRRPFRYVCLGALLLVVGCGGPITPKAAPAGAPTVVTGVWALDAVATSVAGGQARVLDVVPAGADPFAPLTASQVAQVRHADVVVEVGGGYQPSFAAAAAGDARVVELTSSATGAADGPWLDPADIDPLAARIAAALRGADPRRAGTWADGATDTAAEDSSLDADLHSTLATCPKTAIVTPDRLFADLSAANGLTDATTGTGVRFAEGDAGTASHRLDTLVGQPAGGYPATATYADELEGDLGVLSSALSCPQEDQ